jgi:uncharacterized linocin/CFP29 family protein
MAISPENIDWTPVLPAVQTEAKHTAVASKFLPPYGPTSNDKPVSSEIITIDNPNKTLFINLGKTTPIVEVRAQFTLVPDQYQDSLMTDAVTLATRAANYLAQAKDLIVFLGGKAKTADFFKNNPVFNGSVAIPFPDDLDGLASEPAHTIPVPPKSNTSDPPTYGEHTASAVGKAYSLLQSIGHNGPYALVLHSDIFADTIVALDNTLIMPADRIKPFVTETDATTGKDIVRFYGSGALDPFTGLFMSIGGNAVDLVVGNNTSIRYAGSTTGQAAAALFEVYESFTLRKKDKTAIVLLNFTKELRTKRQ